MGLQQYIQHCRISLQSQYGTGLTNNLFGAFANFENEVFPNTFSTELLIDIHTGNVILRQQWLCHVLLNMFVLSGRKRSSGGGQRCELWIWPRSCLTKIYFHPRALCSRGLLNYFVALIVYFCFPPNIAFSVFNYINMNHSSNSCDRLKITLALSTLFYIN